MPKPLVSVCIITYQHARFITQAVEGALMQKTDFRVEILIGEDASTDGTRELCLAYVQQHPDKIKLFQRSRLEMAHADSQGRGSHNFRMTLREASGEFIALCEGDDFWTDPEKLQRQVDYLRANPDCTGCFHDTKLVDGEGQTLLESYFQSDQDKFTQEHVLSVLLSREPTCSLMFRRAAFVEPLPTWYLQRPCDLYLDILLTSHGSLGFIRQNMGAYRKHATGIWSSQREAHQIVELIFRYKLLLADSFFFEKYQNLLRQKIDEFQSSLFTRKDTGEEIARLEKIVHEQNRALETTRTEARRLFAETEFAHGEANRAVSDAQKHIDALLAQVNQLAASCREQTTYIAALEKERDRLKQLAQTQVKNSSHYAKVMEQPPTPPA